MIKWKLKVLLFSYLSLMFVTQPMNCTPINDSSRESGIYHHVKAGQTLYRIALTYDVSLPTVVKVNNISNPNQINVGQRIFIPGASSSIEVPIYKPGLSDFTYWPVNGTITSRFGDRRRNGSHSGIDIGSYKGAQIKAVKAGTVIFSGKMDGFGLAVKIRHNNGFISLYGHNDRNLVKQGQNVVKSQIIALVGKSGNASGYHVHFELQHNGKPVNPIAYLQPIKNQ